MSEARPLPPLADPIQRALALAGEDARVIKLDVARARRSASASRGMLFYRPLQEAAGHRSRHLC